MTEQYKKTIQEVFDEGTWEDDARTGVRTLNVPGMHIRYDLRKSAGILTTKRVALKAVAGELCGFLRGYTSAAQFRELGCKVWDQNANENKAWLANAFREGEDALGYIYGANWRFWPGYKVLKKSDMNFSAKVEQLLKEGFRNLGELEEEGEGGSVVFYKSIDQLRWCLDEIIKNPTSRRILFHAWNPAELDHISLPACHLLYQLIPSPSSGTMSMNVLIRSNDLGLGQPFNAASAAFMLHLICKLTGFRPKYLNMFLGSAHIYETHVEMLTEQMKREPLEQPTIRISDRVPDYAATGVYAPEWLELVEPSDFIVENYKHHSPLTAPMAV